MAGISVMARRNQLPRLAVLKTAAQFIVHDFRHHLSAVYANAEFLGNWSMDSASRQELLGEIRLAVECMTGQLDSFLLFTRTGYILDSRYHSLNLIIEQAIQMVRSHPETRGVTITQHSVTLPNGYIDGVRLCSALFNLLLNACQAARVVPGIKAVVMDVRHNPEHVFIRVSDGGPGISRAVGESLFQPFVKTEDSKGMGLGLTIAQCVARGHGGEVYLEESRPGKTVFVLKLPKTLFA